LSTARQTGPNPYTTLDQPSRRPPLNPHDQKRQNTIDRIIRCNQAPAHRYRGCRGVEREACARHTVSKNGRTNTSLFSLTTYGLHLNNRTYRTTITRHSIIAYVLQMNNRQSLTNRLIHCATKALGCCS
jgi:hypothetical protein